MQFQRVELQRVAISTKRFRSVLASAISLSNIIKRSSIQLKSYSKAPSDAVVWHLFTVFLPTNVSLSPLWATEVWASVKLISGIFGNGENTRTLLSFSDVTAWHLKTKGVTFLKMGVSESSFKWVEYWTWANVVPIRRLERKWCSSAIFTRFKRGLNKAWKRNDGLREDLLN